MHVHGGYRSKLVTVAAAEVVEEVASLLAAGRPLVQLHRGDM